MCVSLCLIKINLCIIECQLVWQVALLWQRDRATRLSVEILQLQNIPIVWHYLRDPTFSRFYTIPEYDRHTHRQTRSLCHIAEPLVTSHIASLWNCIRDCALVVKSHTASVGLRNAVNAWCSNYIHQVVARLAMFIRSRVEQNTLNSSKYCRPEIYSLQTFRLLLCNESKRYFRNGNDYGENDL